MSQTTASGLCHCILCHCIQCHCIQCPECSATAFSALNAVPLNAWQCMHSVATAFSASVALRALNAVATECTAMQCHCIHAVVCGVPRELCCNPAILTPCVHPAGSLMVLWTPQCHRGPWGNPWSQALWRDGVWFTGLEHPLTT